MRSRFAVLSGIAAAVLLAVAVLTQAHAAVTPSPFQATLEPGESVQVTKTVEVPDLPRKLDLFLVVDNTGSYTDDLPTIKRLAPQIFDDVEALAPQSRFGLGTFVDFPFPPWGVSGEYGYRLDQHMTFDRASWLSAVNGMRNLFGNDGPESQYEALYQAATGAGREMPSTTDGDFTDPGEIAPGQEAGFRPASAKVIAITTDSAFHLPGDSGPFPYPGPSRDTTVNALRTARVKVVAIKAPGSTSQMDDVANATGGSVVFTSSTSREIAEAIVAGLENLTFEVVPLQTSGCNPLAVTFDPPRRQDVPGNSSITFNETIHVPAGVTAADLPPGGRIVCEIRFRAADALIGTQQLDVQVVLNKPPDCSTVSASPSLLWPANHGLREITLSGATDPDGDPVTLTVTAVTQDEPIDGLGSGDTSPDARLGPTSDTVLLRAERSARGDGRVYSVAFQGSDGRGGTCSGNVSVGVPRDQGQEPTPIDSGQAFSSFGS